MPMRVWAKLSPSRITYRRLFKPRSTTLARRLLLGDLGQVMHYYHPPAYPSAHPILTMVGAERSRAYFLLSTLMRPSTPARNAKARLNQGRSSYSLRFLVRRPLCGKATRRMPAFLAASSPLHLLCPPQQPTYDAHPVGKQPAVGGIMDVGFHDGGVHSELSTAGDFQRPLASSTARSFKEATVSGPIWLAQRIRVVSSGALCSYSVQRTGARRWSR